jgi:hypothetical protein
MRLRNPQVYCRLFQRHHRRLFVPIRHFHAWSLLANQRAVSSSDAMSRAFLEATSVSAKLMETRPTSLPSAIRTSTV